MKYFKHTIFLKRHHKISTKNFLQQITSNGLQFFFFLIMLKSYYLEILHCTIYSTILFFTSVFANFFSPFTYENAKNVNKTFVLKFL